jgi:hypothetical protein
MLPDQVAELLTAFVDGELSERQREAVMRVLHKSSEARDMLRQLQENAHKLKQLPFRRAEPSLVDEIMQAIAEQKVQPRPAAPRRGARRRWLPYVAATMAASLLVAALGLLFWKVNQDQDNTQKVGPIVKNDAEKKPEEKSPEEKKQEEKKLEVTPKRSYPPLLDQIVQGSVNEFMRKPPPPFSSSFADLKAGKTTELLAREFDRERALEFDVKVQSNAEAINRLKDVLRDYKITLVADPAAKPIDGKKVQYLVYADNLKPDELTKLMKELGETYTVPGLKNQTNKQSPYKNVTVTAIDSEDKQKLEKLTNVKPDPKANRKAVVLPANLANAPAASVAQFANRPAPQAGTLQILIRIHQD